MLQLKKWRILLVVSHMAGIEKPVRCWLSVENGQPIKWKTGTENSQTHLLVPQYINDMDPGGCFSMKIIQSVGGMKAVLWNNCWHMFVAVWVIADKSVVGIKFPAEENGVSFFFVGGLNFSVSFSFTFYVFCFQNYFQIKLLTIHKCFEYESFFCIIKWLWLGSFP